MHNKKPLAILSILRKICELFSSFFFSIYLFELVNGDFNFLLLYAAFNAIIGGIFVFLITKFVNSKNANLIFRLCFVGEFLSILILLILKDQIASVWLFATLQRFASIAYYAVYEVVLIRSAKNHSISSYVAGVSILGSIVAMIAPSAMGYMITNFSWNFVLALIAIDAVAAMLVATRVNFKVIHDDFRPIKYWRKAVKNKTMLNAYLIVFLRRLSGPDGILSYLLPVLLFITLGTEFSAGSYDSLFSIVYIIMLEVIRILNRKGATKRFYVPLALLCLISAVLMISNFSYQNILLFYFTIKTGGALIMLESGSMMYAIGNQEHLSHYTREHQLTWNLFLMLGNLTGIAIAFIVYNNFYSREAFAWVIFSLMIFFVIHSYLLQKIERKLKNA